MNRCLLLENCILPSSFRTSRFLLSYLSLTIAALASNASIAHSQSDTTSPSINVVVIPSPTIPALRISQRVNADVSASDNLSGVYSIQFWFEPPTRDGIKFAIGFAADPTNRISGSNTSGTYRVSIEFPPYPEVGNWILTRIRIIDYASNMSNYSEDQIKKNGWANKITVTPKPPGVPSVATLVSPSGSINTSSPTYTWNAVPNATWYQLWIADGSSGYAKIRDWYTPALAGCSSGNGACAVNAGITLNPGAYEW